MEQPNESRPTVWASMSAKINLGNYQSEDISVGMAGVPIGITAAELEILLTDGKKTMAMVVNKLAEQMAQNIGDLGGFR